MPHKRNPVSATLILAAHTASVGHVVTLLNAAVPLHERAPGLWHAEWDALPQLFGLASGALREARRLAQGLEVDVERMRANIDITRGLLFADSVAGRLTAALGRAAAHAIVEDAAAKARSSHTTLQEVLQRDQTLREKGIIDFIQIAFDLGPSIHAGAIWTDRALRALATITETLRK